MKCHCAFGNFFALDPCDIIERHFYRVAPQAKITLFYRAVTYSDCGLRSIRHLLFD